MQTNMTASKSALDGIRVIDMSRVFAAPVGAQILGDLGADVIKIERPKVGDDGRGYGTAWVEGKDGADIRQSSFFTVANRNKPKELKGWLAGSCKGVPCARACHCTCRW